MRLDKSRILWSVTVMTVLTGTLSLIFTGDEAGSATEETQENTKLEANSGSKSEAKTGTETTESLPKATLENEKSSFGNEPTTHSVKTRPSSGDGCLVSPAALEELREKRLELEQKTKELASKEAELNSARLALEEELKKISAIRDEIEKIQNLKKKENEEKVAKLVEAFETMSPKSAAALLASVDEVLAVSAMSRISTQKLAKIMNSMEPESLARLTERMAGVVPAVLSKQTVSHDAGRTTKESEKGGDKNDGQNKSNPSSSSTAPAERPKTP